MMEDGLYEDHEKIKIRWQHDTHYSVLQMPRILLPLAILVVPKYGTG
jgi:hypothetical protein